MIINNNFNEKKNFLEKVISDCISYIENDIKPTKDFFNSLKEALEIQKLLVENNKNEIYTEDFYEIVDCFLESKNIKDMKTVFDYLEKIDFPVDYLEYFEKRFRVEIKEAIKNKDKKEKIIKKSNNDEVQRNINEEKKDMEIENF